MGVMDAEYLEKARRPSADARADGRVSDHAGGRQLRELRLGHAEQAAQDLVVVLAESRSRPARARLRPDEAPVRRGLRIRGHARMRQEIPGVTREEMRVPVDRVAVEHPRRRDALRLEPLLQDGALLASG